MKRWGMLAVMATLLMAGCKSKPDDYLKGSIAYQRGQEPLASEFERQCLTREERLSMLIDRCTGQVADDRTRTWRDPAAGAEWKAVKVAGHADFKIPAGMKP